MLGAIEKSITKNLEKICTPIERNKIGASIVIKNMVPGYLSISTKKMKSKPKDKEFEGEGRLV